MKHKYISWIGGMLFIFGMAYWSQLDIGKLDSFGVAKITSFEKAKRSYRINYQFRINGELYEKTNTNKFANHQRNADSIIVVYSSSDPNVHSLVMDFIYEDLGQVDSLIQNSHPTEFVNMWNYSRNYTWEEIVGD